MFCGKGDFLPVGTFGPRTLITCSCCSVRCFHIECMAAKGGRALDHSVLAADAVCCCDEVRA